eukprot:TRINITY_DN44340_c0_g1_i1.p1 TRINITY_DN44340_c0_g1~~TRINITY_DN44340_c0_g1_i1.p1  ORF type:complete len:331 (+),score=49.51 TRINITY_DN44340_c0_g1_i1:51-1043(+)
MSVKEEVSSIQLDVDRNCGLVEVHLANSGQEIDTLHLAFFWDRAVEAQWGAPGDKGEVGPEMKRQALERMRNTHFWGDAPEGTSEGERQTLDRLVATPIWECALRLAGVLAAEADRTDGCQPGTILELGAGLGLPGLLAARLWPEASVAVTECSDSLVDLLSRNLQANFPTTTFATKRLRSGRNLRAFELGFGREAAQACLAGPLQELGGPLALILVSDCFFFPWYGDTWTPLRASLLQLCHDTTLVLLCTKHRTGGRVTEALDFVSQPPFHRRRLRVDAGVCSVCKGEGHIDFECCWNCEGADLKEESEEVWLMAKSEAALASWKSGTA